MSSHQVNTRKEVLSTTAIMVGGFICLTGLFFTRYYVFASLIGIGVGVLLVPLLDMFERRFNFNRGLSCFIVALLFLLIFGGLSYGLFDLLYEQAKLLIEQMPSIFNSIKAQTNRWFVRFPILREHINNINLGAPAEQGIGAVFKGVTLSLSGLAGLILILTIGIFTALNANNYFRSFLTIFPAKNRLRAQEVLLSCARVLRSWFKSQLVVMAISCVLTTIGLWILGIDYWLLLGILTGVLGFIPYVGALLTGILTIAVTLGSDPDKVWWVLGLYLGLQQLEGHVTIPLIMKREVQLPEAHLIIFMLIMGGLFGLLGVFIAPPLFALIREVYLMVYVPKMNRMVGGEEGIIPSAPIQTEIDLKNKRSA